MTDMKLSKYYKRLDRLMLWPLVSIIALLLVIVVSQIMIFYLKYIPELLGPTEQFLSPEMLAFITTGIEKIIFNLSIWLFVLFIMNILLIYVIWNVKKLLVDLRGR